MVDALGNLRGGSRRGVSAVAQIRMGVEAELGRLAGLEGWSLGSNAIGLYGKQSADTLTGSLTAPSNVEGVSTLRLNELWLQWRREGWSSLRFGQLAADSEFAVADSALNLVNGTFGWPLALAEALPAGGPAYPLAVPGMRVELGEPETDLGARFGLFAGNPGGHYAAETDPQRHNRYGTTFSTTGGAFMIGEVVAGPAKLNAGSRPWVAKLGAWYHTGGFDAQRQDTNGLSLADPASSGEPQLYRHNLGAYLVGEATLWRSKEQSLAVFMRGFTQPADRNLVSFQVDAGMTWTGAFGRNNDTLSFGVSQARIGHDARRRDRDLQAYGEAWQPVRDYETVVEVNYDRPIGPLHLRPLAQWYIHPAAGAPNGATGRSLHDAVLVGMRVQASF
ncbi:carbohydrate porin [Teichococcus vastitatis]|uniref:Carbohydrate porin n=1 Tax=Teichococcus vastitatis TaxID=2307076 RepID=A0ABS9W6M8_9PROT|nr:carbohydrate porin [Pseudoroseomonas vastitatis]MCI0754954.1 carbohydrate porin [Pseudoroseomonas vastitatis]